MSGEEDIEAALTAQLLCPLGKEERGVLWQLSKMIADLREEMPTWLKGVELEVAGMKGEMTGVSSGLVRVKAAVDKTNGTVQDHTRRLEDLEKTKAAEEGFARGVAAATGKLHEELEASAKIAAAEVTATAKLAEEALRKRQARMEFAGRVVSHDVFKYAVAFLMMGAGFGGVVEIMQRVGLL